MKPTKYGRCAGSGMALNVYGRCVHGCGDSDRPGRGPCPPAIGSKRKRK